MLLGNRKDLHFGNTGTLKVQVCATTSKVQIGTA